MKYPTKNWLALASFSCMLAVTSAKADPQDEGSWTPVVDWPLIAIHAVLTPQGHVMSFGTDEAGIQGAEFIYDVWDPKKGLENDAHETLPNRLGVDVFCSAALLLPETGNVLMSGGDNDPNGAANVGIKNTTVFDTDLEELVAGAEMNSARWYPTSTVLANGEILLSGGTDGAGLPVTTPEIYSPSTGEWRSLLGISTVNYSYLYPRHWVAPNGKIFGYTDDRMYYMSTDGNGSIEAAGNLNFDGNIYNGTAVMYQPGKILQVGGAFPGSDTHDAVVIDINGEAPLVRPIDKPQESGRAWANSIVLPNGKVMLVGGSEAIEFEEFINVSRTPEMWDPATESWSYLAPHVKSRLYHSTAILLADGRVLVAGGGAPGPEDNLDAEIFTPPYLYDDSGVLAARPVITSAPAEAPYDAEVLIQYESENDIARATLIKTGAVTHSFNMEQRFIELEFTSTDDGVNVALPSTAIEATPGYYLLHLLDDEGVPSEAHIIRISSTAVVVDSPVAVADEATSEGGVAITIDVLANDTGSDISLVGVDQSSQQGGSVALVDDQVTYTPSEDFVGTDTFGYTIENDSGATSSAIVTVSVTSSGTTGDYPTATDDNVSLVGNASLTIDALANDSGSGLTLNAPNVWSLKAGNVQLVDNKIVYTPKAGFNGIDKIWYVFQDDQGRTNSGVITITVSENEAPAPEAVVDTVTTLTASPKTIDVLANDIGYGLVLDAPNVWSLNGGSVALVDNKLVYQSEAGFVGSDNIWYTFSDSVGRTNFGRVDITVNSPYPVAAADNYETSESTAITLDILGNDTGSGELEIDNLYAYTAKSGTTSEVDGKVLYTPKAGFTGEDNFWYVMVDDLGRTNSAQVIINVTP